MIITSILGNIHDDAGRALAGDRHVATVDLPSADLVKRVNRVTTRSGHVIGVRLPPGSPDLADGDILALDPDGRDEVVVVAVETTDVLVITPRDVRQALFVAHSLGNRHLQAQFPEDTGAMIVAYDHTVVDFLHAHSVAHRRDDRVLDVPFRHTEHTH